MTVAVLTIVPESSSPEAGMAGLPFPGDVLQVRQNVLRNENGKVRRPRLEVYGMNGDLLLLRPVYAHEEERLLYEEMVGLTRYSHDTRHLPQAPE